MQNMHDPSLYTNPKNSPQSKLEALGWAEHWAARFAPFRAQGLTPARVSCEHREAYNLLSEAGSLRAELSGRFRYDHPLRAAWPAVGDWVAIAARPEEGAATIHAVLPRRSQFSRKAAGDRTEEQVVAANVDRVFLVSSLDGDFNVRRIERYLTVAWESGAQPLIVLNKADCCEDVMGAVAEVEAIAFGVAGARAQRGDGPGPSGLGSPVGARGNRRLPRLFRRRKILLGKRPPR